MKLKVHDPSGEQFAEVSDYAAGALLMSLYGNGSTIRLKNVILWLEGADGNGAESYDNCAFTIIERLRKVGAIQ
jgi:hypothetical protein